MMAHMKVMPSVGVEVEGCAPAHSQEQLLKEEKGTVLRSTQLDRVLNLRPLLVERARSQHGNLVAPRFRQPNSLAEHWSQPAPPTAVQSSDRAFVDSSAKVRGKIRRRLRIGVSYRKITNAELHCCPPSPVMNDTIPSRCRGLLSTRWVFWEASAISRSSRPTILGDLRNEVLR
ncbi:hypothetical protein VTI74DRAFT_4559 [Chaetomium olivicolor]